MTHGEHSKRAAAEDDAKRVLVASYGATARLIVENHLIQKFLMPDVLERVKQQAAEAIPQPIYREATKQFISFTPRAESEVRLKAFEQELKTRGVDVEKIADVMGDLTALVDKMVGWEQGRSG